MTAPVRLLCTKEGRKPKRLEISPYIADRLRARFEAANWTVVKEVFQ